VILIPTYIDANPVTCVPGYERILVATVNDPVANPVTVVVNGVSYVSGSNLTLTARGAVCWTGVINLSAVGLVANTRYAWTATQAANTDSGSYFHTPAVGTDFKVLFAGCDNNTALTNGSGANQETVSGFWEHYKNLFDTGVDIAGMLFPDDIGYVDYITIDDSATSDYGNNSGLKMTVNPGSSASVQADYYIGWCALLGMLGPRGIYTTDNTDRYVDDAWLRLMWARESNRAFCRKNINIFPQWGDHEFKNDMGWDNSPTKGTYAGNFTRGKLAWQEFLGLIQPPNTAITPLDTGANHWVNRLGDLTIASPDAITNVTRTDWDAGTGDEAATPNGAGTTTTPNAFATIYGANQITDIKTAISVIRNPFCLFGMGNGTRYVTNRSASSGIYSTITTAISEYNNSGTQHPIFDHCLAQWQSLVTNSTDGLMANKTVNGSHGCMAWLHSDWHHRAVYKNVHPAYSGHLAESFYSIYHGTTNGSTNFNVPPVATVGATAGSCTLIEYMDSETTTGDHDFGGIVVDIVGTATPKRMDISLRNIDNTEVWSKSFSPQYEFGGMGSTRSSSLFNRR